MGKAKKTRRFAAVKRMISPKDMRLKDAQLKAEAAAKKKTEREAPRHVDQVPSAMFFSHNTALGPPYHIIVDTNFINFAIRNKIDLLQGMMDCLLAKCVPCILDSVVGELEKLGPKYRVALRMAKDPRFLRLPTKLSKGCYADEDIMEYIKARSFFGDSKMKLFYGDNQQGVASVLNEILRGPKSSFQNGFLTKLQRF